MFRQNKFDRFRTTSPLISVLFNKLIGLFKHSFGLLKLDLEDLALEIHEILIFLQVICISTPSQHA